MQAGTIGMRPAIVAGLFKQLHRSNPVTLQEKASTATNSIYYLQEEKRDIYTGLLYQSHTLVLRGTQNPVYLNCDLAI